MSTKLSHMSDLVNMSHEFKTPLNLICSTSQLYNLYLKKDYLEDSKENMMRSNQIINKNCNRLTKLINNIIDVSKLEAGNYQLKLRNHNIIDVIDDIVESVLEYTKISDLKIIFDTEVEDMIIAIDIYDFKRIILNLISNAIKFSNAKGTIVIKLIDKIQIVEITVQDNGCGIQKENIPIIFNKFTRINTSLTQFAEGMGIGLYLAKSLIELHGGTISVKSVLGRGSVFKIKLPVTNEDNMVGSDNQYYEIMNTQIIEL